MAVGYFGTRRESEAHVRNNTLARDKGDTDYLSTLGSQGEQAETLWESGKTIRHLTQEEGQGT